MSFDPPKSREAHPETGSSDCVAASAFSPSASSPASGMRDSQPAAGRGAVAGQPFPLSSLKITTIERVYRARRQRFDDEVQSRGVRPLRPATLHSILERKPIDLFAHLAVNDRGGPRADPALGGTFGLTVMVLVAALIGVMLAAGGVL